MLIEVSEQGNFQNLGQLWMGVLDIEILCTKLAGIHNDFHWFAVSGLINMQTNLLVSDICWLNRIDKIGVQGPFVLTLIRATVFAVNFALNGVISAL